MGVGGRADGVGFGDVRIAFEIWRYGLSAATDASVIGRLS